MKFSKIKSDNVKKLKDFTTVKTIPKPNLKDRYTMEQMDRHYLSFGEVEFEEYFRKGTALLHEYDPDFTYNQLFWDRLSISEADKEKGSPKKGDMIAVNPDDYSDIWLVEKEYFENNFVKDLHSEFIEEELGQFFKTDVNTLPEGYKEVYAINKAIQTYKKKYPSFDKEHISDGYHTFGELYEFRKMYNALLFNEWAKSGLYGVHKSKRHSDGEKCFGRDDYFIVVANLPTGLISNHYHIKDWDLFQVPEEEKSIFEYDGHTPQDTLIRMKLLCK